MRIRIFNTSPRKPRLTSAITLSSSGMGHLTDHAVIQSQPISCRRILCWPISPLPTEVIALLLSSAEYSLMTCFSRFWKIAGRGSRSGMVERKRFFSTFEQGDFSLS